jgi:hypothetical protein
VTNLFAALGHTRARYFIGRYQRTMLICDVSALSCALSLHRAISPLSFVTNLAPRCVRRARDKDKAVAVLIKRRNNLSVYANFVFAKSKSSPADKVVIAAVRNISYIHGIIAD